MLGRFSRTELLLGEAAMKKLADSRVAIFGVGGVGSFVAEGLVRAGVGHFLLVDNDLVCLTNLNRQIHATMKTVGKSKTEVMKERMLSINPEAEIETVDEFFLPETADKFFDKPLDYIVDAVDTVTAKIGLVMEGEKRGIPVMSSMGAGNKLDPSAFRVADIYETRVCPLAKVMRKELRARGIKKLKVVYSEEQPIKTVVSGCGANCICPSGSARNCDVRRAVPGSVSFVPSVAGLIIAGEVVKDLTAGVRREVGV